MTNSVNLFSDELTEWLLEAGLIQSQCQMSIYYKYPPDGKKNVLYYVDDYVYCYNYEFLGKWFLDALGMRFHVNFLGYTHWFVSIRISQMKYHYISVDRARYYTSIVAKYLDTATVNTSTKFYKTNFPFGIIFTKAYASTIDKKVE